MGRGRRRRLGGRLPGECACCAVGGGGEAGVARPPRRTDLGQGRRLPHRRRGGLAGEAVGGRGQARLASAARCAHLGHRRRRGYAGCGRGGAPRRSRAGLQHRRRRRVRRTVARRRGQARVACKARRACLGRGGQGGDGGGGAGCIGRLVGRLATTRLSSHYCLPYYTLRCCYRYTARLLALTPTPTEPEPSCCRAGSARRHARHAGMDATSDRRRDLGAGDGEQAGDAGSHLGRPPGLLISGDLGPISGDLGRSRLLSPPLAAYPPSLGTTAQLAAGPSVCTGPSTGHAFPAPCPPPCVCAACAPVLRSLRTRPCRRGGRRALSLPLSPRPSLSLH
mmetsp:Transcript_11227/g.35550  ORF Transcript_11227/g.35550 Transcript_11227/m.35550 type:complete len:337 (-) Transcript_11227:98-1108(-)